MLAWNQSAQSPNSTNDKTISEVKQRVSTHRALVKTEKLYNRSNPLVFTYEETKAQ